MQKIEVAVQQARIMLQASLPAKKVLHFLASTADECVREKTVASILILDAQGLLRNGGSPQLPADYLKAIDAIKPNPDLGTCAAAAATGEIVITPDFQADTKWAELRHLPMALGFLGAWSFPIKDSGGNVLGTFGTYFRERREPTKKEMEIVRELASVAAEAITFAGATSV